MSKLYHNVKLFAHTLGMKYNFVGSPLHSEDKVGYVADFVTTVVLSVKGGFGKQ